MAKMVRAKTFRFKPYLQVRFFYRNDILRQICVQLQMAKM